MSIVTKEMLDAAVIVGRNQERERIIKLLEEAKADELDLPCQHATFDAPLYRCDTCEVTLPLNDLIALIKGEGENK